MKVVNFPNVMLDINNSVDNDMISVYLGIMLMKDTNKHIRSDDVLSVYEVDVPSFSRDLGWNRKEGILGESRVIKALWMLEKKCYIRLVYGDNEASKSETGIFYVGVYNVQAEMHWLGNIKEHEYDRRLVGFTEISEYEYKIFTDITEHQYMILGTSYYLSSFLYLKFLIDNNHYNKNIYPEKEIDYFNEKRGCQTCIDFYFHDFFRGFWQILLSGRIIEEKKNKS